MNKCFTLCQRLKPPDNVGTTALRNAHALNNASEIKLVMKKPYILVYTQSHTRARAARKFIHNIYNIEILYASFRASQRSIWVERNSSHVTWKT